MRFIAGLNDPGLQVAGSILTVGNFDGLHKGHQIILERVRERARRCGFPAVLLSFEPHPIQVLKPEQQLKRLFPLGDLRTQVEKNGLDILVLEPFDHVLAALPAQRFLDERIVPRLHPTELVVGHDFSFGKGRDGTPEFLQEWCQRHQIQLWVQPPYEIEGERISSRRIRELVIAGEMQRAELLLGRPFYLEGVVEKGAGRGKTIGTPTMNLHLADVVVPRTGVYVTRTRLGSETLTSVSNLGVSPTFNESELKLETHVFDFARRTYGQTVQVELLKFLRPERKFANIEELKNQIHLDIQAARDFHLEKKA